MKPASERQLREIHRKLEIASIKSRLALLDSMLAQLPKPVVRVKMGRQRL